MCGISGIWKTSGVVDSSQLEHFNHTLNHRGPDAKGNWISEDETLGLAQTRLSIIDLSSDANQPFFSSSNQSVLVFNGEIYNFQELSQKIPGGLRTNSDTEVLIELLEKKGPETLSELNGMFAFAYYSKEKKELLLARDRIGIKPLYVFEKDGVFAFASEIKALVSQKGIKDKLTLDPSAVDLFLHLGYIPEPWTIYSEIRKFPKGNFAKVKQDLQVEYHPYWAPFKSGGEIANPELSGDTQNFIHELIRDSVKKRMIADVPLGTFLSGGTDSSLISAVAAEQNDQPIKTFNISFKEKSFDESEYARKVAQQIGSDHTEYQLGMDEAMELLWEMQPSYDQPYGDTSAIPVMLISSLAREQVKVILTGDGGDELFLGYGSYSWADRLENSLSSSLLRAVLPVLKWSGQEKFRKASRILGSGKVNRSFHIFSQEQYLFSEKELLGLGRNRIPELGGYPSKNLKGAEKQARFDLSYYLPDDLLEKVDKASMKSSLECRVPLLDHRIIEASQALRKELKMKKGEQKIILKRILENYLPKDLIYRKKWGFSIPMIDWLLRNIDGKMSVAFERDFIHSQSLVNPEIVEKTLGDFKSGNKYLYNKVWHLWVLFNWLKSN